MNRNKK
jgi:hypothetical protein